MCALIILNSLTGQGQITIEKNVTSFILTDEGDNRMIDSLEAAGCTNLFQALLYIRDHMDANAPVALTDSMDALIDTLNTLSGIGEVFTASLHDFTGNNSPVGINADGTFIRSDWSIYSYDGYPGYARYNGEQLITYATAPEYNIFQGSYEFSLDGILYIFYYMGFAVAWDTSPSALPEDPSPGASFSVYPNPFHDGIFITSTPDDFKIELWDYAGKRIFKSAFSGDSYMPLSDLPEGIYILRLGSENQTPCRKIIKKN